MRALHLTTPLMVGDDVKTLQKALHPRYLKDGTDGAYGILTAQAVHRAKFWLGYRKPDQVGGQLLLDYLTGKRKPTKAMLERAAKRKRAKPTKPLRLKALDGLRAHLGEKEHPAGSNRVTWASIWYGVIGAWCAMAVSRVYSDAGSIVFKRGQRYAYVPYIVGDARAGRNHLTVTNHPEPGDLVCYDWDGDGVADHVGLFEEWIAGTLGAFRAIEGNTAVGNDSNGGEVMRRERRRSQVQAFVHVGA